MKNFTIKVTEHREGLYVVEAEDANDALERWARLSKAMLFGMTSRTAVSILSKLSLMIAVMIRLGSGATKATATCLAISPNKRASAYPMPFSSYFPG